MLIKKNQLVKKVNSYIETNKLFDNSMDLFTIYNYNFICECINNTSHVNINIFIEKLVLHFFEENDSIKPELLRKIRIINYLFILYKIQPSNFSTEFNTKCFIDCLYNTIDIFDKYNADLNIDNWWKNDFFNYVVEYVKNNTTFNIEHRFTRKQYSSQMSHNNIDRDVKIPRYQYFQCPTIMTFVILYLICVITSRKMVGLEKYLIQDTEQFEKMFIEFNNSSDIEERKKVLEKFTEDIPMYNYFAVFQKDTWLSNFFLKKHESNNVLTKEYNMMVLMSKMLNNPIKVKFVTYACIFVESKLYVLGSGASFSTIEKIQIYNRVVDNIFGRIKSNHIRYRKSKEELLLNNLSDDFSDNLTDDFSEDLTDNFSNSIEFVLFDEHSEQVEEKIEEKIESLENNVFSENIIKRKYFEEEPIEQIFFSKKKFRMHKDYFHMIDFFYFPYNFKEKNKKHNKKHDKTLNHLKKSYKKKYIFFQLDKEEQDFLSNVLY